MTKVESPASLAIGNTKCSILELAQRLSPDALLSLGIALTLGNRRISEMSLGNGPVFMVCQSHRP